MAEGRIKNTELAAIAAAIRAKNGSSTAYKPSEMAAAIGAIPGPSTLGTKSITANGTYAASGDNLDGYSIVTVNVSGGGGGFPAGYKRLAYVRGDGSGAYINTGITPTSNTWITETIIPIRNESADDAEFGCRVGYENNMFAVLGWRDPVNEFSFDIGNTRTIFTTQVVDASNVYNIIFNKNGFFVNGENASVSSPQQVPSSLEIFLLSVNNNGSPMVICSKSEVLDFQIGKNNAVVMHLIPCQRISDSAVGFYDIVGGAFYGNAGSGSLIAGPELS